MSVPRILGILICKAYGYFSNCCNQCSYFRLFYKTWQFLVPLHTYLFSLWWTAFNWTGSHTVGISHIQAEYDNCTKDPGEVLNSSGPGVIVPLGTSGSFYFYCTVDDHCGSGQKFAINALTNGSEPPSPSSASSFAIGAFVAAVVSTIVITVLIYD